MSKSKCDVCVADKSSCLECCENPIYANVPTQSLFRAYVPTCPRGYDNCVFDPAYIRAYHPDYYHDLYGDLTPEQASEKSCRELVRQDPDEEHYCYGGAPYFSGDESVIAWRVLPDAYKTKEDIGDAKK